MTFADLLPVRIGLLDRRPRRAPQHSAVAEVARQKELRRWADLRIRALAVQVADAELDLADAQSKQEAAELLVVQQLADIEELTAERNHWRDEALALRARFSGQLAADANENAISVRPGIRDTSDPADQATGPIDVRPLWEALGATDPAHVPAWANRD